MSNTVSNSQHNKALLALVAICLAWGTTWLASKIGVQYLPPFELTAIRQTTAGIIFLSYFLLFKRTPLPTIGQLKTTLVQAIFFLVLSNGLTTFGIQYIPSGLAAILSAMLPIWLLGISALFGDQIQLNKATLSGLILGFIGVIIIFYEHLSDLFHRDFLIGTLFNIVGTITWAIGTVLNTRSRKNPLNIYYNLGWQMLIAGIILFMITAIQGNWVNPLTVSWKAFGAIAYLVIVGSIIAFVSYLYALKHLPAAQVSIYSYINPMVAVMAGAFILQEPISWWIISGSIVTLLGVYLVNIGSKRS